MLADRPLVSVALLSAIVLAGCFGSGLGSGSKEAGDGAVTENRSVAHGVELAASIDRASAAPDEAVEATFRATNVGDEPVRYREGCWHEWSLEVVAVEGDETYSYPQVTCQGFSKESLAPGATHEIVFEMAPEDWTSEEAPPAGMYRLDVGFLFGEGGRRDVTTALELEVVEG